MKVILSDKVSLRVGFPLLPTCPSPSSQQVTGSQGLTQVFKKLIKMPTIEELDEENVTATEEDLDEKEEREDKEESQVDNKDNLFQDTLINILGFSEKHAKKVISEGFEDASSLALVTDSDISSLWESHGLGAVSTVKRARFHALRTWVCRNGGEHCNIAEFTAGTLANVMRSRVAEEDASSYHKGLASDDVQSVMMQSKGAVMPGGVMVPPQKEAAPKQPDSFDGQGKNWRKFRLCMESYLARLRSGAGRRLVYVIQRRMGDTQQPSPDQATPHQDQGVEEEASVMTEVSMPPLVGDQYNEDNNRVFQELKAVTAGGGAWSHIRKFDKKADGRAAWLQLIAKYEGDAMSGTIRAEARRIINYTKYTGENRRITLDKFIRLHLDAHADLEEHNAEMPVDQQIEIAIGNIECSRLSSVCDLIIAQGYKSFDDAMTFLSQRAQQLGVVRPDADESRRIGSTSQRRANSHQRGKGNKGRDQERNRYRDNYIPSEEWNKMSRQEQEKVIASRSNNKPKSSNKGRNINQTSSSKDQSEDEGETATERGHQNPPKKTKTSAGVRFGRNAESRSIKTFRTSERYCSGAKQQSKRLPKRNKLPGRFACDSHADTTCIGASWVVLEQTEQVCSVHPYSEKLPPLENIPIVTGATAYDHPDTGETFILVAHQALWLGEDHKESLICPNQLRYSGLEIDDIPHKFSGGSSIHGVRTADGLTLPFILDGTISYLPTRAPTDHELDDAEHIYLTSELPWDPTNPISTISAYQRRERKAAAATTVAKKLDIDIDIAQWRLGGVSEATAITTLAATTQLGTRDGMMPLSKRYKTRQQQLRKRHLACKIYSDTMIATKKSKRGHLYTQCFATADNFCIHFPMLLKSQAHEKLQDLCDRYGVPAQVHTDNANEETKGAWARVCREFLIKQTVTEPYSPWQN